MTSLSQFASDLGMLLIAVSGMTVLIAILAAAWLRDIEEPEPRIIQWLVGEREGEQ